MIGVFDSGYGGLTILKAIIAKLPNYSYIYFGDNAKSPYGSRSAEEITELTWQGVEYLFEQACLPDRQGCPLVILGCNTASAVALRPIQQELLPKKYPDHQVLGIVVPTIEQITGVGWNEGVRHLDPRVSDTLVGTVVGILGTEQTVKSQAYVQEIHKRNPTITVIQQSCPELVPLIEAGAPAGEIKPVIENCLQQLFAQNNTISSVVLACTHYILIEDLIRATLPAHIKLFDQPRVVAESLATYLTRHPEIEAHLDKSQQRIFITTGDPIEVSRLSTHYFGEPLKFSRV